MKQLFIYAVTLSILSCNNGEKEVATDGKFRVIGTVEKLDTGLESIVTTSSGAEVIAEGFDWSEGPVWVEGQKMLLFSDVPRDSIFKWTEAKGKEVYLTPSGYTDTISRGGEMGSNGLLLDKDGRLVLCQHGNRQMAVMDAALNKPEPKYIPLANVYNGKKLNSPNDAVYSSKGDLYFTDPPYGLEKNVDDPKKEIPFQGVYKVKPAGEVVLMTDSITRPNGIAIMPGEKMVVVANSDPAKPNWYLFDLDSTGNFINGRIFYSAAGSDKSLNGLPDGLKIDKNGNVFATGPGGIWIFNKDGKLLGRLKLDAATSNCAFSPDQKTLYITNDMYVLRWKMRE